MLIVQNEYQPARIQSGLFDLMRHGVSGVRLCSAYVSLSGSEILCDEIRRCAADGRFQDVTTVATSLDYGLTEPEALEFWMFTRNCTVLVAGTALLKRQNLVPNSAFHTRNSICSTGLMARWGV
jgi:hypothetical protein